MIKRGVKDPNVPLRAAPTLPCLCLLEFALLNYWPSFAANASVQTNQRGTPRSPLSSARLAHSAITPNFMRTRWGWTNLYCFRRRYLSFPPSFRHRRQPLYSSPTWLEPVRRGPGLRCCMWRTEGGGYLQRGEREKGGGGRGDGEACILIQLFFFSTSS